MSSDKTAIDKLRGLLDERGVHHCGEGYMVRFNENGHVCRAYSRANRAYTLADNSSLDVVMIGVSPEQAIAATLGRGTCYNSAPNYLDFLCSECGFVHYHSDENDSGEGNEWRYCPNCGRKVVDE